MGGTKLLPEESPSGYTRVHVYIVLAANVRFVALEGGQVIIYRGYEYYINRWKTYAFVMMRRRTLVRHAHE